MCKFPFWFLPSAQQSPPPWNRITCRVWWSLWTWANAPEAIESKPSNCLELVGWKFFFVSFLNLLEPILRHPCPAIPVLVCVRILVPWSQNHLKDICYTPTLWILFADGWKRKKLSWSHNSFKICTSWPEQYLSWDCCIAGCIILINLGLSSAQIGHPQHSHKFQCDPFGRDNNPTKAAPMAVS